LRQPDFLSHNSSPTIEVNRHRRNQSEKCKAKNDIERLKKQKSFQAVPNLALSFFLFHFESSICVNFDYTIKLYKGFLVLIKKFNKNVAGYRRLQ